MNISVKTNPSSSQNPSPLKNTQQNEAEKLLQLMQNKKITLAELEKILQQQEQNNSKNNNDEFIVKNTMKASTIALRIQQILLTNKNKNIIKLSAIGYAIVPMLDAVMLIRKDFQRLGKEIQITNVELFERTFETKIEKTKIVTGLKITLQIQ